MLGYYNYTVILTYAGMLTSFLGIILAVSGDLFRAVICLMISGLCDMLDGKVASTMERTRSEKNFGIQIDSLSDLVCFGVFPAVVVHLLVPESIAVSLVCALYVLCTLIRLAYFNVDEAERQEQTGAPREQYRGLPVTTVALVLPLLFCVRYVSGQQMKIAAPVALLIMALAFLLPFRLRKPALPGKIAMSLVGLGELVILLLKGGC